MNEKRILIVDDEDMELLGLSGMIRSFDLNAVVCGTARNGIEGCEKTIQLQPDIIISDVKMPQMTGIEMARELRRNGWDTPIIYISGYQDFSAVREAVSIGARDFLLKPISRDLLLDALQTLCGPGSRNVPADQTPSEEADDPQDVDFLQRFFLGSDKIAQEELIARSGRLRLPVEASSFVVMTIQLDSGTDARIREIRQVLHPLCLRYNASPPVSTRPYALSTLFSFPAFMQEMAVADFLEQVGEEITAVLAGCVSGRTRVGVSGTAGSIRAVSALYQQSLNALDNHIYGSGNLFFFTEDPNLDKQLPADISAQCAQILQNILDGNESVVAELTAGLMASWEAAIPFGSMQRNCVELTAYAAVLCKRNQITCDDTAIYWRLIHCRSAEELRVQVTAHLRLLTEQAKRLHMDHSTAVIQQICKIIHEEYPSNLTVEDIASRVYFSPSYIRRIFKSQTGSTLLNYLQSVRMEKALEFLSRPQYKIHEIGMLVGYDNPSYFNLVFKKYYGVTPGAYREHLSQKE